MSRVAAGRRGNRVIAAAAPGMAPQQPVRGEKKAARRAMRRDRLLGVMRAAWLEAAAWLQQRRDDELIGADETLEDSADHAAPRFSLLPWIWRSAASRSPMRSLNARVRVPLRATNT